MRVLRRADREEAQPDARASQASVNYATEKAHVVLPAGTDVDAAIATVEATGYTARLPEPPPPGARHGAGGDRPPTPIEDAEVASLRRRLLVSAALTRPGVRAGDGRRRCSSTTGSGCR